MEGAVRSDAALDARFAGDPARADHLVLVDALDNPVGTATKEDAHRRHLLHRAFSVVLVRQGGGEGLMGEGEFEVLIARRAPGKYHSEGLWANSCCSHPRVGEEVVDAAYRRVREELGLEARDLREIGSFVYYAPFESGVAEFEYDHVLLGTCAGEPDPDPTEVDALRWVSARDLAALLQEEPATFAVWATTVLPMALAAL